MTIRYGIHPSPFGDCLVATTNRGICALRFGDALNELREEWPAAHFIEDARTTSAICRHLFDGEGEPIRLHLRGTNFQLKVWQALLSIPAGQLASYSVVAGKLGAPNSTRAVASAIARNPVGYLIPCHRVIQSMGIITGYRWGSVRKQAMIGWEASRYTAAAIKSPI